MIQRVSNQLQPPQHILRWSLELPQYFPEPASFPSWAYWSGWFSCFFGKEVELTAGVSWTWQVIFRNQEGIVLRWWKRSKDGYTSRGVLFTAAATEICSDCTAIAGAYIPPPLFLFLQYHCSCSDSIHKGDRLFRFWFRFHSCRSECESMSQWVS